MSNHSDSTQNNMTAITPDSTSDSPHDHLLPQSLYPTSITRNGLPRSSYSITLSPLFVLRILSTVFSLTAFIVFVIDGGDAFIAADIFLALIMIYNCLMVLQHSLTHVFKVTVELRGAESDSWRHDIGAGRAKTKPSRFVDLGLAVCLLICVIVGNACIGRWHGGAWKLAVVFGWFVAITQGILAVSALEKKSLTLTAKFNDLDDKVKMDVKLPTHIAPSVRPTSESMV